MNLKASGVEPGQRRLNGLQATGREYRSLSEVEFNTKLTNDVAISMRDGTKLLADLFQPDAGGRRFPALLSASPYPRQFRISECRLVFWKQARPIFLFRAVTFT